MSFCISVCNAVIHKSYHHEQQPVQKIIQLIKFNDIYLYELLELTLCKSLSCFYYVYKPQKIDNYSEYQHLFTVGLGPLFSLTIKSFGGTMHTLHICFIYHYQEMLHF